MRATLQLMRTAAVALLLWALASVSAAAQQSSPDVILVTIDTLRADHVGCYGYKGVKTPALDSLAREGIRFTSAFTASPITNSSHASILTGLYPSSHGVTDFGVPLAASHTTLAELLKSRGYHTAAFIGAVILDSRQLAPGFDRGFDYYDNFPQKATGPSRFGRLERRGMDVVQRAEKWLAANKAGPRFVWVHLYDPHDPYEPPPPYAKLYKQHPYDGEIAYADHALGELMTFLRAQGRLDRSLIIAVGDHGEGLGEHHEQTHGIFLYDSTTHVPLIARLPAAKHAGEVVNTQVRTVDIVPTILDYSTQGTSPAPEKPVQNVNARFDGTSLRTVIDSAAAPDEPAASETDYPLRFGWAPLRSMRAANFKFIEAPRPELYNLKSDPAEQHNIYEPWQEKVQDARAMLARLAPKADKAKPGAVPNGTVDELRALGYLGPEGATTVPEPFLLPDPKDKIEIQNLLHTAMIAGEDGRTDVARNALLKAIEADPQSATAFSQLGELELKAGNYTDAASRLQKALQLRPDDPASAFHLGEAREKAGNLTAARDDFTASLKLAPGQVDVRQALGRLLLRIQQPAAAAEQFEAALFLQPQNAALRIDFARSLLATAQYDKAVGQLQEAIRIEPGNRDAYALLQAAYDRLGKHALAQRAARRDATLVPPRNR